MKPHPFEPACPAPLLNHTHVQMAHGGGGRLMNDLIASVFLPAFGNPGPLHDGAVLELGTGDSRLAFTTDSFVVRPLEFPGGDIGSLAVNGTVNDLAMCGARPRWVSAGFILEEGLPMGTLRRVVESMRRAANEAGRAVCEVVQVYLHDVSASVVRPVRQLVGVARVELEPGRRARVGFRLHADLTSFTGRDLARIVEPGAVELHVAASSADIRAVLRLELVGPVRQVGPERVLEPVVTVAMG